MSEKVVGRVNKNIKKAICIILIIIIAMAAIALFVMPKIPVRRFEPITHTILEDNEAYERAYNIYGKVIFKNRRKALGQFKKEYESVLEYIDDNTDYGKFNTSYKTLNDYYLYGLNGINATTEDERLLNRQLNGVAVFTITYMKSSYREYIP